MQIKSIKKQKNGNYKIIGHDDSIMLADEIILKYNILYKKELTDEEINKYQQENYKYECLNKTIKYIHTKMRSKKEIDKFLTKYTLNASEKKSIINKLTDLNLINDKNFVSAYVYDHFNLTHDGPYKIKKDLLKHNILENDIDNEIAKINNQAIYDKLTKLLIRKIKNNNKYPENEFKRKMEIEYYNLGYDYNMIDQIIDENFISLDEDALLEKEIDKLISKYQKKYESSKLQLVLKQKLYQKGYSIDSINQMINKKLQA